MTMTVDYPNNKPTPEKIAKLPKWAQELIADLEYRTHVVETVLKKFNDAQTPSGFFVEERLGVGKGSDQCVKRYIQTYRMSVEHGGVRLDILLLQDEANIHLQWYSNNRFISEVALVPTSFQKIKLVGKENIGT